MMRNKPHMSAGHSNILSAMGIGSTQNAGNNRATRPVKPIVKGNLSTDIRYEVPNPDGSISTVRTISVGTDQGEVVIPTVINGRVVSDEEAIRHFEDTGENFGIFRTIQDAGLFAERLHRAHEKALRKPKN